MAKDPCSVFVLRMASGSGDHPALCRFAVIDDLRLCGERVAGRIKLKRRCQCERRESLQPKTARVKVFSFMISV